VGCDILDGVNCVENCDKRENDGNCREGIYEFKN
jgi:hypothetical protein